MEVFHVSVVKNWSMRSSPNVSVEDMIMLHMYVHFM